MNAKQAARAASKNKRIAELEDFNRRCSADIRAYVGCIISMIGGASPCAWCEEENECQLEAKGGKGCKQWWLKNNLEEVPEFEEDADLPAGTDAVTGVGADGESVGTLPT